MLNFFTSSVSADGRKKFCLCLSEVVLYTEHVIKIDI